MARRAGTSRPTLSACQHGHKSPRLDKAGYTLAVEPRINFRGIVTRHHRLASVPDHLARLPVAHALASVELPMHLDWSSKDRIVDLADRRQRARCYETILGEGTPDDINTYVDGALFVDLWNELVLRSTSATHGSH